MSDHVEKSTFQQALDAHVAGNLLEAETLYRANLQDEPHHPDANHNLGVLKVAAGKPLEALPFLANARGANPAQGQYWVSHIAALIEAGQLDSARTVLQEGRQLGLAGPAVDELALRLFRGSQEPAQAAIDALVKAFNSGDYSETLRLALALTQAYPGYQPGWKYLGAALYQRGQAQDARVAMQKSVELNPADAEAHNNLGVCLKDLGRIAEAEASHRQATVLQPHMAEAYNNLGIALKEQGRFIEAEACYRQAVALKPDYADAYNNLGNAYKDQGRLVDAEASYRQALALKPDYAQAHSNLLFSLNYLETLSTARALEEARRFGANASRRAARYSAWHCADTGGTLRVGFVSGDFRNHPVGYFLEGLLGHIDPSAFALLAYPTAAHEDALTERIKPFFRSWHPVFGKNDAAAAQLIHDDVPHILIDLAGHTAHNRLPVFAYKPAPVQVSWLGYFATTGLGEIDYLLGDPHVTPPGEEQHFSERIWRLPETYLCFTPPPENFAVDALPALHNGYVTFGCFNNLAKMNAAVVALWAKVLHALPHSRLFLKSSQLADESVVQATLARFGALGIAPERLITEGFSSRRDYLLAYNRIDIALDPFPYPGGTTTVEGLWMGVPVVTLRGDRFLSHNGETLAHNSGQAAWIAQDGEDYVAKALRFASDLHGLARTRAALRAQLLASPLCDARRFARNFEEALRSMYSAHAKPA